MIDPISLSMMAASIGLQFFTNRASSKKQIEIQEKQREFQRAQQIHDFERMRILQEETSRLNREIEAELHSQRLKDIDAAYDEIIDQIANDITLRNWPITLLPFVLKGEKFGSFVGNDIKTIKPHCILTTSNNEEFNNLFYRDLDYRVQAFMNENWHAQSSHPIVYHGGGWKIPKQGSCIPSVDLNDIERLKLKLQPIPMIIITPFFDYETERLSFILNLWGMGKDITTTIIPDADNSKKRIFSYDYFAGNLHQGENVFDDFYNTTLEEFVPFIVSLIGFVCDKYYWAMYKVSPILPQFLRSQNSTILIPTFQTLYSDELTKISANVSNNSLDGVIKFYHGAKEILPAEKAKTFLSSIQKCLVNEGKSICSFTQAEEFRQLRTMLIKEGAVILDSVETINSKLNTSNFIEYELIEISNKDIRYIIATIKSRLEKTISGCSFLYTIWNDSTIIGTITNKAGNVAAYKETGNYRIFVFCADINNLEKKGDKYYQYNYMNQTNTEMEKTSYEERYAHDFEQVGRKLGQLCDRAFSPKSKNIKQNSVWDDEPSSSKKQTNAFSRILEYFISNAGTNVPATKVETVSMNDVLNWVDSNVTPYASKVYVIKSFVKDKGKFIVCLFFANESNLLLSENDKKGCIISTSLDKDFEASFNGNDISEIPLK